MHKPKSYSRQLFLERVVPKTEFGEHWLFTGWQNGGVYGQMHWKHGVTPVHVLSYQVFNGPIPPGHHVHHTCETPLCWHPDHLCVLTQAKHNTLHHKRSLCRRGLHRMEGDNLLPNGKYFKCKACTKIRQAEWYATTKGQ